MSGLKHLPEEGREQAAVTHLATARCQFYRNGIPGFEESWNDAHYEGPMAYEAHCAYGSFYMFSGKKRLTSLYILQESME